MPGIERQHTLAQLLDEARSRIERLEPGEAFAAAASGALIIDIRSDTARTRDGIVPGSLHIPRTVLEWRVDPESPWRNPHVGGLERRLLLLCDHGYSSSLAAATMRYLGFERAGDVIGGFDAWRGAGFPVAQQARGPVSNELPGMGPPDQ